jgi:cysteine-rich repeat protein
MNTQIKRTVMIRFLVAAAIGLGACLSLQSGIPCGDKQCLNGELCVLIERDVSVQTICVSSGVCGNGVAEAGEECDDGNLVDEDDCLSICKLNRCGDSKVALRAEACDDGNNNNDDGCNNDCTLSLSMYVKASNTGAHDYFGFSVALSADGSTLAVGAYLEDSAARGIGGNRADNSTGDSGAVYVFTWSGTKWRQQAYVKASNTGAGDHFGISVALSADGSTLAVGAVQEDSAATGIGGNQDDNSAEDSGAVYVFVRSGTTWSQQAYVKASNTGVGDRFGDRVALSADGSTLAVGAWGEDSAARVIDGNQADNSAGDAGAVYVFTRSGPTWSQQAYVKASNTDAGDYFRSVALSADGSILVVGAYGEDSAARVIGGNQADNSAGDSGAVYVFTRSGPTWSQQAYVKASNTDAGDYFGGSVALSADGSTLVVGADGEDSAAAGIGGNQANSSAYDAGAVYVFTRSGPTWSQQAYVKASNTGAYDRFGASVALSADGSTLAVGAYGEDSAATGIDGNQADNSVWAAGAVYVFTRSGPTWSQQAYVKASNTNVESLFGYRVTLSMDGSTLAVSAPWEASAATGIGGNQANNSALYSGAVYVYPLSAQQSSSTTAALSEPDAPASAASVPGGWLGP